MTVFVTLRGQPSSTDRVRWQSEPLRVGLRACGSHTHAAQQQRSFSRPACSFLPRRPRRVWLPALPEWAGRGGDRMAQDGGAEPWPTSSSLLPPPHTHVGSLELPFPSWEIKCFFPSTLMAAPSVGLGKLQPDHEWGFRPGSQAGSASLPPSPPTTGGALRGWGQRGLQAKPGTGTSLGHGAEDPRIRARP